jgi:Ca-activated chloride channel family protein
VKSHLNEQLLRDIASTTKGIYLPLRGANTIDALYQQGLAPLPRSDSKETWMKRARERYHWPLGLAIVLLIAEIFFPERRPPIRRERNESNTEKRTPNGQLTGTVVLAALCLSTLTAHASPSSAMRDYKAGKFPTAQKEFERLAEADKKGDMRFIFDAGDCAYRATNYDAALKFFTTALASHDVKLQQKAYFNMGNTQYRIGQLGKDLDEIQNHWEEAVKNYQNAVTLDKTDVDATYNLEFAKHSVEQIKQLREAARQAKQAADAATRQHNYHRALEIMQGLLQNNPLGKQFEEFTKKLQNIDAIANPPAQP